MEKTTEGFKVDIIPISVNKVWQGRRFKTQAYTSYEKELLFKLGPITIPSPPYEVTYKFGMSNSLSDWDNPTKPFQDVLQKKYRFNDRDIHLAHVYKIKTEKGKEFIEFSIKSLDKCHKENQ